MRPPRLVGGETGKTASCRSVSILESKRYEQNDIRVPEHTNCGHSGKHTNSGRRARIRVDAHSSALSLRVVRDTWDEAVSEALGIDVETIFEYAELLASEPAVSP